MDYAQGESYQGKTSPYWYTSENFFELFQSFSGSVRELISQFDGCTGSKAGKVALSYAKVPAAALGFKETEGLLGELRTQVKNVNPERLGRIGRLTAWQGYHKAGGFFQVRSSKGNYDVHDADAYGTIIYDTL